MILSLIGSKSDGGAMGMLILFAVFIVLVAVFGIMMPILKKSRFNDIKEQIRIGMTEDEMREKFGDPVKTVVVNDDTKVVLYSHGEEWIIRGNIRTKEILAVIVDGVITSITM